MKIAINRCWGGFGISEAVFKELGIKYTGYGSIDNEDLGIVSDDYNAYRASAKLISAIEKVGIENASDSLAKIYIVDIPDDVEWEIDNYDGMETIHENTEVGKP
jgi:hypothetical protein